MISGSERCAWPKIGVQRDRARAGGQQNVVMFSRLAVDGRPMRKEHAAAGRGDRRRLLSRVTGPLTRTDGSRGIDRQCSAAGIEDDSAADLIAVGRALAEVNRARGIDELDRAAVAVGGSRRCRAPPGIVTWPVVFLTTS